jgi:predicted SprT family Zn-dependent metalloprotease
VCYNKRMDYQKLLDENGAYLWPKLQKLWPALGSFGLPQFRVDKRLKRSRGLAYQETRIIRISHDSLVSNYRYTMVTILPHELIHIADFDLYGLSELKCGHGIQWQKMMIEYGLHPTVYSI